MSKRPAGEIDLLELFASFFLALKRNLFLAFFLPAIGIFIALAISLQSRDRYQSSLLIETSLLSENESKFLFEQLQKVGAIPGMKREQYQEIEGFEFKVTGNNGPVLQGQNYFQVDRSVYLEVTARVFDKDVLPALEKSIVQFINESKPVVRHRAEREKFYGEVIAKINSEITAMDRLKNQVDKHEQATFLNPSDLYANAVTLLEKKAEYEIKRKEIQSIHLLKGFDSLTINAKLSLLKAGAIGFAVGFAVLCFLLFIKYFAYFFKRYETTH